MTKACVPVNIKRSTLFYHLTIKIMRYMLASLGLLLLAAPGFSQTATSTELAPIKSIVRETGWEIPGLSRSRIMTPRKPLPGGYGPNAPVNITIFKPRREVISTISLFRLKPDRTTLVMGQRRGAVQIIIKCDIDDRVFAYIVQFMALVREWTGRVGYSGIYGAQYFDNDGDGIFESYEPGPPFVTTDRPKPCS
jgi:hypothetical protein